jgi:hypothetical protein
MADDEPPAKKPFSGTYFETVNFKNTIFALKAFRKFRTSERLIIVEGLDGRLKMIIRKKVAELHKFFFPASSLSVNEQLILGWPVKNLAEQTMTILCLIALHFECTVVKLQDDAAQGCFKLSNKRFVGPTYLDYYGKHYGFVPWAAGELKLEEAAAFGNRMREHNIELAHKIVAKPVFLTTAEQIVSSYFLYSKNVAEGKNNVLDGDFSMDVDMTSRYRYLDPYKEKKEWVIFDDADKTFKVAEVDYIFDIKENVFVCK